MSTLIDRARQVVRSRPTRLPAAACATCWAIQLLLAANVLTGDRAAFGGSIVKIRPGGSASYLIPRHQAQPPTGLTLGRHAICRSRATASVPATSPWSPPTTRRPMLTRQPDGIVRLVQPHRWRPRAATPAANHCAVLGRPASEQEEDVP